MMSGSCITDINNVVSYESKLRKLCTKFGLTYQKEDDKAYVSLGDIRFLVNREKMMRLARPILTMQGATPETEGTSFDVDLFDNEDRSFQFFTCILIRFMYDSSKQQKEAI